ncbi:hypothetical protein CANTEDRAFT_124609 [Yamadazyma tenuis ATCC 10573]|uniref:tRNA-5-taurinomethyluridine 2-sulfurtransferase n=1 Tax=Candida tenuis (strain ATCC 10573 / BCRC 21748 / CBS 615 / JCM 9827 / NBRC 10315 / NRRL Y-1498 / VKM Y-70) TaxID=590646 RepID=G3B7M1_CANTC|nr:uncharacterized protein CANTEDRAFT_124609 [Yamadazyma tenuis ATCC 10573]EGV62952.1 hypothetical protein CANTEDRAFT_124609 [Yamadazyma tenuis ATCC 10573]
MIRVAARYLSKVSLTQPVPKLTDTVVIAMSSGVDSSVAASLYKHYPNVKGIYMANWHKNAKCNEQEWKTVQEVCQQLQIPCERVGFEKEYWQKVFSPMIDNYSNGLTPNPDLDCNKHIKFGELVQYLDTKHPTDYWLVTGHYARVMNNTDGPQLLRAVYGQKDQSYYLSSINPKVLSKLLFPIGHMTKPQVRAIAADLNLVNKDKPDSMGLCFVSQDEKKFDKFLDEYIEPQPGNIITEDGKVWGQHNGLWYGTIGQRAKISMPQGDPRYQGTWFISEKRYDTNELVIVKGNQHPALFKNKVRVGRFQWLQEPVAYMAPRFSLQYRSLQSPVQVETLEIKGDEVEMKLVEFQRAMAPGQSVVVYDGDRVLGSANGM